jgi:hypothetical protein
MLNVPTIYEPVIRVCPKDHDFGNVEVGRRATTTITIMDCDGCHLHISDIHLGDRTDSAFSIPDRPILPTIVPSESSMSLHIAFCPRRKGCASGCVEIASDDPLKPLACVILHGAGV